MWWAAECIYTWRGLDPGKCSEEGSVAKKSVTVSEALVMTYLISYFPAVDPQQSAAEVFRGEIVCS